VSVPDYLTYYFRDKQRPFEVLTDLDPVIARNILKDDVLWRGDGTYLEHRRDHERLLRDLFIQKGGHPSRQNPIYAILGESPTGPHDLENEYAYKIRIPLRDFSRNDVSFTYPDSLYEVPLEELHRLYLPKNARPTVYTIAELAEVVRLYRVYEINNHYIEAQVWNDRPLAPYTGKACWRKCAKRQWP
jgi:hypothetical protein